MTAVSALRVPLRVGTLRLIRRAALWAVLLALAVGWVLLLRPTSLGGPASYLVVAGVSMEPNLYTGDFVIVHRADWYEIGDVVAYPVPENEPGAGSVVIHRIVGVSGERFAVQGDNKDRPDSWEPTAADIIGKSWLELPGSGRYIVALRSPLVLAVLLGVAAACVAYGALGGQRASRSQPSEAGEAGPPR